MKKIKFILSLFFIIILAFQGVSDDNVAIPFKNIHKYKNGKPLVKDGRYIQHIFNNILLNKKNRSNYLLQNIMSAKEYKKGQYSSAWNRARGYYQSRYMYVPNSKYFMTHGLYKGRNCIEVYNSEILREIVQNQKMFNSNTIVKEYNKIKNNAAKRKEFEEKLGRLASYFDNNASKRKLQKYLGRELYNQMMNALKEENTHMLTGALIHEGMHALLSGNTTAAIQQDFNNGRLSMELNELRSYMAEILYHCHYCNWAKNDIIGHWDDIANLIDELEGLRKKPPDFTKAEKEKIEEIKAKIKAHIAMIRVRLREIKKSAERMDFLMGHYKKNYMKTVDPKKDKIDPDLNLKDNVEAMAVAVTAFKKAVDNYAKQMEQSLKDLENILDIWNIYKKCDIDNPPPADKTKELIDTTRTKPFPEPPIKTGDEIKKKAERELGRNYIIIGDTPEISSTVIDFHRFSLSGGVGYSGVSMSDLNDYFEYLNKTWNGNIEPISGGLVFTFNADYYFTKNIGIGVGFENISTSSEGTLETYNSSYSSLNQLNGIFGSINVRSNPVNKGILFIGSVGVGQYFSKYTENEEGFITEGTDNSIGVNISGAVEYMITPSFGMQAVTGYRYVNCNNHSVAFFLPEKPPVSLNYSGIFGEVKAVIKF